LRGEGSLTKLLGRKRLVWLGLNSGTSADGLDLAALRLWRASRNSLCWSFIEGTTVAYPVALRRAIHTLIAANSPALDELMRLDQRLGMFFGEIAQRYIEELGAHGVQIDAIASHGQTIHHLPTPVAVAGRKVRATLQIGVPEQIAARTGLVTVARFREADIALGGEGAPITTTAMFHLFADEEESRLIVNIGGIANYFYFPAGCRIDKSRAADCGPGNSLLDGLASALFGRRYDRDGRLAARGQVSKPLLQRLLRHTFFRSRQVSTGREEFGPQMVAQILTYGKNHALSGYDLMATATEFTAVTIRQAITPWCRRDKGLRKLYLTGGGGHNSFLVSRLIALSEGMDIRSIDALGIPADLVEAAGFAVLGDAALRATPLPTRFGGSQASWWPVAGAIVQPPVAVNR